MHRFRITIYYIFLSINKRDVIKGSFLSQVFLQIVIFVSFQAQYRCILQKNYNVRSCRKNKYFIQPYRCLGKDAKVPKCLYQEKPDF